MSSGSNNVMTNYFKCLKNCTRAWVIFFYLRFLPGLGFLLKPSMFVEARRGEGWRHRKPDWPVLRELLRSRLCWEELGEVRAEVVAWPTTAICRAERSREGSRWLGAKRPTNFAESWCALDAGSIGRRKLKCWKKTSIRIKQANSWCSFERIH